MEVIIVLDYLSEEFLQISNTHNITLPNADQAILKITKLFLNTLHMIIHK